MFLEGLTQFFFVYSIAALSDDCGSFVSVGEDRTLRVWKGWLVHDYSMIC